MNSKPIPGQFIAKVYFFRVIVRNPELNKAFLLDLFDEPFFTGSIGCLFVLEKSQIRLRYCKVFFCFFFKFNPILFLSLNSVKASADYASPSRIFISYYEIFANSVKKSLLLLCTRKDQFKHYRKLPQIFFKILFMC